MIRVPYSLFHATYLPLFDQLMEVTVPSPECRTVSRPVFDPKPIDPSQPDAAAAALLVLASELVPTLPPIVKMRSPAVPPDK